MLAKKSFLRRGIREKKTDVFNVGVRDKEEVKGDRIRT